MNDRAGVGSAETIQEGVSPLQEFVSRGAPIDPQAAASRLGRPVRRTAESLGTVRNGVVVSDEPTTLPEGTRVRIVAVVDQISASNGPTVRSDSGSIPAGSENSMILN
jgi:hypothetical protein